ncbi:UNVERIFIED_CONTAM: putative inactive receptor kinase [Sesamum radiatum]|uniref:Inactive receptor kinase n=1 Tax=Sesamum radiatum TaxID=300843 RepID=A0AAW2JUT5_SESRA
MSSNYDNWERLVAAVLRKEQLWQLFHAHSRSPSILSEASDFSSSVHSSPALQDVALGFSKPASPSAYRQQIENGVVKLLIPCPKLVLVSGFPPAFDVRDVILSSAEFLGSGTFGSSYMATMENGVKIVVKRLKPMDISVAEFKRQMEIVGNVRHENVATLRTYYFSKGERFMLYDYYGNGSVFALLHGQTSENPNHVDWATRLRIAIGTARGIAEIHTQNDGKLVHGNIKSSNIFLNPQQYGCVADLGVANMAAITFMPTAPCYALEVRNTQTMSHASDVYSFGILLLELLTRKSPVHVPGGPEAVDLVKLVSSVKGKDMTAKVIDADLLKYPAIREQMLKVLQMGLSCVAKSLKRRPKMSEVVKMLEDMSIISMGTSVSSGSKLIFVVDENPTFDLEDILSAPAQILGTGTFGNAYMVSFDNGHTIMVRISRVVNVAFEELKQHMEIIGRIRHENVAKLRAYCIREHEAILVYEYYNQKSTSVLLHGQSGNTPNHVDWATRLRIAIGAARGIAEIHTQNGGRLVHGNIKSSNIFLNPQQYGCVLDLGVANMAAITFMPTARCYAPEVKNAQTMSQASDVYSFGILLLELLTRKSPECVPGGPEAVDLVKLVSYVKGKDMTAKVFDADLLKYPTIREQMVKVLQIGISCVAKSLKKRPKMSEVVKMLEDMSIINIGTSVFSGSKLVFVADENPTFDLEDMLRAFAHILGRGTFGTAYMVSFDNGDTIMVRILRDVNVAFVELQQHMQIIGRIRHENVAKLRAYCIREHEAILVYEYFNKKSTSALLHGKRGTTQTCLDWETRIRIAVGVARGVAHIHRQDGGKLVHGNIKSSNIFLNRHNYGLVSDVGLPQLRNPISRNVLGGYCAPEVQDTKKVSQASDVYSFGVVLFELVSRRQTQGTTIHGKVVSVVDWIQSLSPNDWTAKVIDHRLRYRHEEAMVQVLKIGMDCAAAVPQRRPKMPQVVRMLEEISGVEPSNESRWEDGLKPTFIESILGDALEPASSDSSLEDLLEYGFLSP